MPFSCMNTFIFCSSEFLLIMTIALFLSFLTLCASVGNKRGFSIVDAWCNHEVHKNTVFLEHVA